MKSDISSPPKGSHSLIFSILTKFCKHEINWTHGKMYNILEFKENLTCNEIKLLAISTKTKRMKNV